jgi:hypothetical protein
MSFTDFKEVTSNNVGSTTRYGGNDLKEWFQILNGKTVAGRRPNVANPWLWSNYFDMAPPASAPGNPSTTNASRFYVDPSDFRTKIKKTDGNVFDIENTNIAETSLIGITNKAKLPTSIVYKDQNNDMGDFYMDFGDIGVPSNPATGVRRLFVYSATGELSIKTSGGTITSLESGGTGGGGGGDVFLNQANTHGDFDNTFRSGRLLVRNPANTFSYNFVGSAIVAARSITLPLLAANDTLITANATQAVTKKTLTQDNSTLEMFNSAGDRKFVFHVPDGLASGSPVTIDWPGTTANDTILANNLAATPINKTINATNNTITDNSTITGDLFVSNGTKFVRRAKGSSLQVLRTNSAATDIEFASLDNERVGKSTASGNGATTVFNIAHGIGAIPTYAFVNCSSLTNTFTYTLTSTNIVVTFSTAPVTGTNNVIIYWIAVA